jgi:hypothetical protein
MLGGDGHGHVDQLMAAAQQANLNTIRFFAHGDNNGVEPPAPLPAGFALQTSPGDITKMRILLCMACSAWQIGPRVSYRIQ